jgi:hypothetical protein
MKSDFYVPLFLPVHSIGSHSDVRIVSPQTNQVLQYVEGATPADSYWYNSWMEAPEITPGSNGQYIGTVAGAVTWVDAPVNKLFTGGADLPYANVVAAQAAILPDLLSGRLPYWDGSTLTNSPLKKTNTTEIEGAERFLLRQTGSSTDMGIGDYSSTGVTLIVRSPTNIRLQINGNTTLANVTATGFASGLGASAASAPLHARSASGAQQYWDYSSGVNATMTVDSAGNPTLARTGTRVAIAGTVSGDYGSSLGGAAAGYGFAGGHSSSAATQGVALGFGAVQSGYGFAGGTSSSSALYSIALGQSAAAATSNTMVCGSGSYPINTVWAGKGETHATPTAWGLRGTGGSGTNIAGGDLYADCGAGTGTGASGVFRVRYTTVGTTGTTLQSTWNDALTVDRTGVTFKTNSFLVADATGVGGSLSVTYDSSSLGTFPASRMTISANSGNITMYPGAAGTAGKTIQLGYYDQTSWKRGVQVAHASTVGGAYTALMPDGGGVSVGFAGATSAPLHARNASGDQLWLDYSSGVNCKYLVTSGGIMQRTASGSQYRDYDSSGAYYTKLTWSSSTAVFESGFGLSIWGNNDLKMGTAGTTRFHSNNTGLAFYGGTPVAKQTLPSAVTSSTAAIIDAAAKTAIDELQTMVNSLRTQLIATTLVS